MKFVPGAAVAAVLALSLTACSGSAADPEAKETVTVTATPTESASEEAPTQTSSPTEEESSEGDMDSVEFFPRADYVASANEKADLPEGGTIEVQVKDHEEGAPIDNFQGKLVVTIDGKELSAPIEAGDDPMVLTQPARIGTIDVYLVVRTGGDSATYEAFREIEGELAMMATSPGHRLVTDTGGHVTWVGGADHQLFTAELGGGESEPGSDTGEVFRWVLSPHDQTTLDVESLGERCFDWQEPKEVPC